MILPLDGLEGAVAAMAPTAAAIGAARLAMEGSGIEPQQAQPAEVGNVAPTAVAPEQTQALQQVQAESQEAGRGQ